MRVAGKILEARRDLLAKRHQHRLEALLQPEEVATSLLQLL